jgi:hypothetical protein
MLAYDAEHQLLALANRDGTADLWDLATQQVRFTWQDQTNWFTAGALAPSGQYLVLGKSDGTGLSWIRPPAGSGRGSKGTTAW